MTSNTNLVQHPFATTARLGAHNSRCFCGLLSYEHDCVVVIDCPGSRTEQVNQALPARPSGPIAAPEAAATDFPLRGCSSERSLDPLRIAVALGQRVKWSCREHRRSSESTRALQHASWVAGSMSFALIVSLTCSCVAKLSMCSQSPACIALPLEPPTIGVCA